MRTLGSIMISFPVTKILYGLISWGLRSTSRLGKLTGVERLEAFALKALAENYGASEATWVGNLVRRVERLTRTGLLSFSTFNTVW